MRNLLMAAAMMLTLGAAAPALADGLPGHATNARTYEQGAKFDRDVNAWERAWSPLREDARFTARDTLTRAKLIRRLEAQGYYRVRDLTPGRFGNGWRAMATYRGHLVVLRVDQFTGRVLAAHFV
jgi:hypothetical protein